MALLKLCNALKCDFQWLITGTRNEMSAKVQNFTRAEPPDFKC